MNTKLLIKLCVGVTGIGMFLSLIFGFNGFVNAFGFLMIASLIVWHKG